jgi:MoaA/NifB/PqqE/SkfB family radical SAM enzyme
MTDLWSQHPAFAKLPYEGRLTHEGNNRPLYLRIETVNTCNNHCIICAYVDQERPKSIMPMEMFEKAVKDYVAIGGGYLSLTPLVGDIFLDRLLLQRLEFLRGIKEVTSIGVTTNAAMAHRFDDNELGQVVCIIDRISISVYGTDREEYETMTKRDTYAQMVEGIRRIITLSQTMVSLEFRLLNKKSRHKLFEWLCKEILPGVDPDKVARKTRINSSITDYGNWGIYNQENNPLPPDADAKWFSDEAIRIENRPQCLWPVFACIVFSNGNVSLCACVNYNDVPDLCMGHIMENSLSEIYNSERAAALWNWEGHCTPEFCKSCTMHIPLDIMKDRPSILTNPYQVVGG